MAPLLPERLIAAAVVGLPTAPAIDIRGNILQLIVVGAVVAAQRRRDAEFASSLPAVETTRRANRSSVRAHERGILYAPGPMPACPTCSTENPAGNRFCGSCGSPLEQTCAACGNSIPAGDRFCGQCGTATGQTGPAAAEPEPAPSVVEGERRLVSVLFADLTGFTPFSEKRDPEEVRGFLTKYFERSQAVIESFGGVVDKFIGDAVMAVWGAKAAHEDDAERAVRAGLELTDAVAQLGAENEVSELALRVGILTGEASVGPGGNEQGLVVGDMVNTASRLQSIAEAGTVFVGETTFRAAQQSVAFTPIGEHQVKGKEIPVAAFRADRIISEAAGRGRAKGLEPPFVGRVDELRLLKDSFATVGREQRARMVSIVGQAGIGKSRLIWEFRKYLDGIVETVFWHEGRSPAYGDGVTLWALGEMIRGRAGIAETDDATQTRELLRDTVARWSADPQEAAWLESRLASLLGVGAAPVGDQAELFAAVRTFFERVSGDGTTVLVFEDLHWADPALLDFVDQLPDGSRDHPVLIVTLARPDLLEHRPGWGQGRHRCISLHLGPLADVDMGDLIDGMVPGIPLNVRESVIERTGGIPLYAVEIVRMLLATGDVVAEGDGFAFEGQIGDLAVPESLQAVIGARLDRLESEDRALIQDCAILGHSFTTDSLAHITGIPLDDLEPRLEALVRADLLEPNRDPRSPERGQYMFVQSLIREVAHGRISREVRRRRHLEVATFLQTLGPELAPVAASHFMDAYDAASGPEAEELRGRALDALLVASDRAAGLHSYDQALALAERALGAAAEDAERAPIWERIAPAASWLADRESAIEHAELAIAHYRDTGDDAGLNRAMSLLGQVLNDGNLSARAIDLLQAHLEGKDLTSDPHLATAAGSLARAMLLDGRPPQLTADTAEAALPALEAFELTEALANALISRGTALSNLGRPRQAMALIRGGLELADGAGLAATSIRGRINTAYSGWVENPQIAFQASEEAYAIAKRTGQRQMLLFLSPLLGFWYAYRADFDQCEAVATSPEIEDAPDDARGQLLGVRALRAGLMGDATAAAALREQAATLTQKSEDLQVREGHRRVEQALQVLRGDLENAYEASLRLYRESSLTPMAQIRAAMDSAMWMGDRSRLQEILDALEAIGASTHAYRRMVEAMLGVVTDPSPEALAGATASLEEFDDRSDRIQGTQLAGAIAANLPEGPHQETWDNEFRARADKWGMQGILDLYLRVTDS